MGVVEYARGREEVDMALRRLLAAHAEAHPPLPTTRELYRESAGVPAAAPDPLGCAAHHAYRALTVPAAADWAGVTRAPCCST